jgi:hypothetical protein
MRRPALAGALVGVVILLVGGLAIALPYLNKERDYRASVPQPPSLIAIQLIRIEPGENACLHNAPLNSRSARARFQVETFGKPTVPLRLEVTGRNYHASAAVPASSYQNEGVVQAGIAPPSRDLLADVCVVNGGRRTAALYATTPNERSAASTTVAGHPIVTNPWIAFYERKPVSIAHRLPTILERMGAFRPGLIGSWLLWPLAVLFVVGVPAAILFAYGRALRGDDSAS